ncbi:MAG: recombinase family protein [Verrucomicrobiaceae bacterium]|nr:MAG: recombinase family protein [Verrucomicrobiaceae bacterium]
MQQFERFVCYFRVSTQRQGESGLGLDAQRRAVETFLKSKEGEVVAEFTEVESGRKVARPQLAEALGLCRRKRAILVIAKLDRLARNVHFISGLMEAGVEFTAVDQPTKDRFMLHIQAAFAEEEARRISQRTKAALQSAKLRGVDIGATGRVLAKKNKEAAQTKAEEYRATILEHIAAGSITIRALAASLNCEGIPSPGGASWHIPTTHRVLKRLNILLRKPG